MLDIPVNHTQCVMQEGQDLGSVSVDLLLAGVFKLVQSPETWSQERERERYLENTNHVLPELFHCGGIVVVGGRLVLELHHQMLCG